MALKGRAILNLALLATPRPRSDPLVATPDADRPPNSTDTMLLRLAPHSDAAPDEKPAAVSNASRRLRALAALSGSLTDPLTAEEAADLVEQQALTELGASSAVVVTLAQLAPNVSTDKRVVAPPSTPLSARSRDVLTLVHAIGLTADVTATLQQFSLDAPVPLAEVARTGEPIFIESPLGLRRYPEWGGALIRAGACAAAAVPVWANRHLRGVLGLTWAMAHVFDEDERAFVVSLGVMCALAIMRGRLTVAERRARETAELANQAKTQFLRTISHELRTPMTAVIGYTGLLSDEVSGPMNLVQKDYLRRMRDSSEHMLALIEELLGFAKLDAGEDDVCVQRVIASEVVEEALGVILPLARKKGLRVRVEMPDTSIELHTDPLKLRQILINLIANAVKYTDRGDVLLIVRIDGVGAELRIYFEVTDSGQGISAEDQQHIFESFWQVDRTLTRTSAGTGLGLAVARQLARLLGGDVVVEKSELGRGSTFVASLPPRFVPAGTPSLVKD
jgi:signal transduction histidine kinase